MKRTGAKFQVGDRFMMKRTFGDIPKDDIVEIKKILGKKKRRMQVEVTNAKVTEKISVIYLGKRVK